MIRTRNRRYEYLWPRQVLCLDSGDKRGCATPVVTHRDAQLVQSNAHVYAHTHTKHSVEFPVPSDESPLRGLTWCRSRY